MSAVHLKKDSMTFVRQKAWHAQVTLWHTELAISFEFCESKLETRIREKKNNAVNDICFSFGGFFEISKERLLGRNARKGERGTVAMGEEKEEDRRGKLMVLINRSSRRARAGTISEAWWLTACPSCPDKNSSPLRHVANTCPALASASADLFTTCCRPIPRHPVLFRQRVPERPETISRARRDDERWY